MTEIFFNICLLFVGIFILVLGSDWLVQGCVKVSFLCRLTPLFIGLVLIAFGTSIPEAGVGIMAAIRNQKAIALGNIVGSNIANIGLVLGLCALLRPLDVNKSLLRREMPLMLLSMVLLYVLSLDLVISRLDGLIFIFFFMVFCFVSYKGAKKSFDDKGVGDFKFKKQLEKMNSFPPALLVIILSLSGIIFGADLMVRGGVALARIFAVSPWIIGVTVFAIGTSLPELTTSLTASFKGIPSISLGNIIGSNIFNILFVLGIVTLIRPVELEPSILRFELPVMFCFSIVMFVVMKTGHKITRLEGLAIFLGYIIFLFFLLK